MKRLGSKRARLINTCISCRSRKIKCDKQDPCSNCIKYNTQCTYNGDKFIMMESTPDIETEKYDEQIKKLQDSITHLEGLIASRTQSFKHSLPEPTVTVNASKYPGSSPYSFQSPVTPSTTTSVSPGSGFSPGDENSPFVGFGENLFLPLTEAEKKFQVNIFTLYTTVKVDGVIRRNSTPLSWRAFFNSDRFLDALQKAVYKDLSFDSKLTFLNQIADVGCTKETEKIFNLKYHEDENLEDLISFKEPSTYGCDFKSKIGRIGLFTTEKDDLSDSDLIDEILSVLPNKGIINLYVDRFFTYLYPFMPIVDQITFLTETNRILSDLERGKLLIKDNKDLAQVGVLLIMLRLSYVSLFTCNKEANLPLGDKETIEYLLENSIDLNAVGCAQKCLNRIGILSDLRLGTLQLALMIRGYQMYGPEYVLGSGGNESYSYDVIVSVFAEKLGIFYEFKKFDIPEREKNLRRKIAAFILSLSLSSFGALNCIKNFRIVSCDIEIPEYTPENSNNLNEEVEKITIQLFKCVFAPRDTYKDIPDFFENYLAFKFESASLKLAKIYSQVHKLDDPNQKFTSYQIMVINTFCTRFFLQRNLVGIQLRFLIYNKIRDPEIMPRFVDVVLYLIFTVTIPLLKLIFDRDGKFYNTLDIIYIPTLLHLVHRILLLLTASLIRMNLVMLILEKQGMNANYVKKCRYMLTLFSRSHRILTLYLLNLSNRYYYGWRTFKTQHYYMRCISLLPLESIFPKLDPRETYVYSEERLDGLIAYLEFCLMTVGEISEIGELKK